MFYTDVFYSHSVVAATRKEVEAQGLQVLGGSEYCKHREETLKEICCDKCPSSEGCVKHALLCTAKVTAALESELNQAIEDDNKEVVAMLNQTLKVGAILRQQLIEAVNRTKP
jgi:hypothetical protein